MAKNDIFPREWDGVDLQVEELRAEIRIMERRLGGCRPSDWDWLGEEIRSIGTRLTVLARDMGKAAVVPIRRGKTP